jgi:hypothetical protein
MKKMQMVFVALLCLSSAACAQSGPRFAGGNSLSGGAYSAMAPSNATPSGVVQNANLCPPDVAEAVWGAGSAPLGYRCVRPSAN